LEEGRVYEQLLVAVGLGGGGLTCTRSLAYREVSILLDGDVADLRCEIEQGVHQRIHAALIRDRR
jgi:hypothetical protein